MAAFPRSVNRAEMPPQRDLHHPALAQRRHAHARVRAPEQFVDHGRLAHAGRPDEDRRTLGAPDEQFLGLLDQGVDLERGGKVPCQSGGAQVTVDPVVEQGLWRRRHARSVHRALLGAVSGPFRP